MKLVVKASPEITLYHATYAPYLPSIEKYGLGARGRKNYTDSKKGVVYLAADPNVAESYAEESETVPDSYLDQIVILQVTLPLDSVIKDRNVRTEETSTYEFHGVIPWSLISIYETK